MQFAKKILNVFLQLIREDLLTQSCLCLSLTEITWNYIVSQKVVHETHDDNFVNS